MRYLFLSFSFIVVFHLACASRFIDLSPAILDDRIDDTQHLREVIANANAGAIIRIPAGELILSSSIKLANADNDAVSIEGIHSNLTTVLFNGGGFELPAKNNSPYGSSIRKMTMMISHMSARAAIYTVEESLIEDVIIKGTNPRNYWRKSVEVFGKGANIVNCHFIGKQKGDLGTLYHVEHHGKAGGGNRLRITNSILDGAKIGVYIHDTKAEGHTFTSIVIKNVDVVAFRRSAEPTFRWTTCWLKASELGLQIDGTRDSRIRSCVISISGDEVDNTAFAYSHRTQQNSTVRSNLITAKSALRVLDKRPNGSNSSRVNDIGFFANYIRNSEILYDLEGDGTGLFFMGNVLDSENYEFDTSSGKIDRVFRSELEIR